VILPNLRRSSIFSEIAISHFATQVQNYGLVAGILIATFMDMTAPSEQNFVGMPEAGMVAFRVQIDSERKVL
jgi:hypothetical protein